MRISNGNAGGSLTGAADDDGASTGAATNAQAGGDAGAGGQQVGASAEGDAIANGSTPHQAQRQANRAPDRS